MITGWKQRGKSLKLVKAECVTAFREVERVSNWREREGRKEGFYHTMMENEVSKVFFLAISANGSNKERLKRKEKMMGRGENEEGKRIVSPGALLPSHRMKCTVQETANGIGSENKN